MGCSKKIDIAIKNYINEIIKKKNIFKTFLRVTVYFLYFNYKLFQLLHFLLNTSWIYFTHQNVILKKKKLSKLKLIMKLKLNIK